MSRHLPPRPNLEYLKKEAKELLEQLNHKSPDTRLADAQHALALDYGFESWPKLKTYVESRSGATASPFAGKWVANVAKSKQHPANRFRSATLEFNVEGNTVTIRSVAVTESGKEERSTHTLLVDGHEHPSEHSPRGYVGSSRWVGTHVLEVAGKKDGQLVGVAIYEVSADGNMLRARSQDAYGGDLEHNIAFDRA